MASLNNRRGMGAGNSVIGAWIADVGAAGGDGAEIERDDGGPMGGVVATGRYSNPCDSAYVVASNVKESNCSSDNSGGHCGKHADSEEAIMSLEALG